MANFAKLVKDEISRIARREAGRAVDPVRKPSKALRRSAADLKRRVAALEAEVRFLKKELGRLAGTVQSEGPKGAEKARITAKGMRSLRRRLRLSGLDFAKLLGITPQMVYTWDKASGPLRVRQTTRAAVLAVRGLGAREAKRRLAEMKGERKATRKRGRRTRRAKRG